VRIVYYIRHVRLTGGTRIAALHVALLREMGHDAVLATRFLETDYPFPHPVLQIRDMTELTGMAPDVVVTCKPGDCREAAALTSARQVYFCQDYDLAMLDAYHAEKLCRPKYAWWGGRALLGAKKALQARKLRQVYRLPTEKWVVSPQIARAIRADFDLPSRLIRNCIDPEHFHPQDKPEGPTRILCVGDYALARKNIPTALKAVARLKRTHSVHFIRVTPGRLAPQEQACGVIDEAHEQIPNQKVAEIMRSAHILLSPSTEEGFGLPPVEAMACGTLAVLADIPAYHDFHAIVPDAALPYARYFPPLDPEAMAGALAAAIEDEAGNSALRANGLALAQAYLPSATREDLQAALDALNPGPAPRS